MPLSNKQKNWIVKNQKKHSAKKLAEEIGVSEEAVIEFLSTQKKKKTPFYFYFILTAIPILFFILLELSLRFFEYGYNNKQWIPATEGKLILNPEIARRYFFKVKSLPYSNQEVFDEIKKENTFRVFVMGGSSTQGFPFAPLGAFSRYLQQRLELLYPASKIEVVNLGITAVNTYTIRNFIPGVLEQNPDLIIIYAGHNEYYGALGVGSMESFGTSRNIINLTLSLNRFKIFELLTDIIRDISNWFSSEQPVNKDATLMARMVKEQYITLDSNLYYDGILQFECNMRDILNMIKEKKVKILLSTLTCNTRDQKPFVSVKTEKYPLADKVFKEAQYELSKSDRDIADSLFTLAKELDALRFRAPEKINELIKGYGSEYKFPVVDIDSVFRSISPFGIVGDNLMTDHLHPTLEGYQLIGKTFFDAMISYNYLPKTRAIDLTNEQQDSIIKKNFIFSRLDSIHAHYRITALKNNWPYIEPGQKKPLIELLKPKDYIDSLVFESTVGDMDWEYLHRKAASWFLENGDIKNYKEQMDILISQFPVIVEYYNSTAYEFLKIGSYDIALPYLTRRYELKPDAFSTKWIGIIDLSKGKNETAIKFLEESLKFDRKDPQVLFNLSGAYSRIKEYKKALEIVNRCLIADPKFSGAADLKKQLEQMVRKVK
jgi:tetratricopeptide (TPR) repeat protein